MLPWLGEEEVIAPAAEESAPGGSFFYTGTLAEPAPTEQPGAGEPPVENAAEAWPALNPMPWEEAAPAAAAPTAPETSAYDEIDLAALFEETREPESSLPAAPEILAAPEMRRRKYRRRKNRVTPSIS